jgi:uncharacterized protein
LPSHKAVVEAYVEGFRRTDHEAILACLADDVVWVLHGYRTLRGKEAFDGEIENDAAVGSPTLNLDRLIEEGDTVVAVGSGEMTLKEAGRIAPRPDAGHGGGGRCGSPRRRGPAGGCRRTAAATSLAGRAGRLPGRRSARRGW